MTNCVLGGLFISLTRISDFVKEWVCSLHVGGHKGRPYVRKPKPVEGVMARSFSEMVEAVGFLPALLCVIAEQDVERLKEVPARDWLDVYRVLRERNQKMMHAFCDALPEMMREMSGGQKNEPAYRVGLILLKNMIDVVKVGTFWKIVAILEEIGDPKLYHLLACLFTPEVCERVGARKSEAFLKKIGEVWAEVFPLKPTEQDSLELKQMLLTSESRDLEPGRPMPGMDSCLLTETVYVYPNPFAAEIVYTMLNSECELARDNERYVTPLYLLVNLIEVMLQRNFQLSDDLVAAHWPDGDDPGPYRLDEVKLPTLFPLVFHHPDCSEEQLRWLYSRMDREDPLQVSVLDRYALHLLKGGTHERMCAFLVYPSLHAFKYKDGEIPRDDSIRCDLYRKRVRALREVVYQTLDLRTGTTEQYVELITALRATQKATTIGDWKQYEDEKMGALLRKRIADVGELIDLYVFVRQDEKMGDRVRKRILKHDDVQRSAMDVLLVSMQKGQLFGELSMQERLRRLQVIEPGVVHADGDDPLVMSLIRVAKKQRMRASSGRRWCREFRKLWNEVSERALLMSQVYRLVLEETRTEEECEQLILACGNWFDDVTKSIGNKQTETALFKLQLEDYELYLKKVFAMQTEISATCDVHGLLSLHSDKLRKEFERRILAMTRDRLAELREEELEWLERRLDPM